MSGSPDSESDAGGTLKVVFTTLFLALVVGTQTVKVEIEGAPHRVVFMVDGVEKAADEAPP